MRIWALKALLFSLTFILVISCSDLASSAKFSTNNNSSFTFNSDVEKVHYEENQSLYNRMISDFFDQRIGSGKSYSMGVYSDTPSSLQSHSSISDSSKIKIDNIIIDAILGSAKSGALFVGFDSLNKIDSHKNGYENATSNHFFFADGKSVFHPYTDPFDVWYEGKLYYPLDAVYSGIITIDELTSISLTNAKIINAIFDSDVPVLDIEAVEIKNTILEKLQNAFFNQKVKNNPTLESYCADTNCIHIVETFSSSFNVIVPEFGIDNYGIVPFYTFCDIWDSPLTIDGERINPINSYVPIVYINDSFLRIDDAFKNGFIDKKTIKEILNKLPNHNSSTNKETYPYEENQSFYNRVIMDYYEQKVLPSGCVNKFFRRGLLNYEYGKGIKMNSPDGYVTRSFRLPSIALLKYGKSSSGVYLFLFSDEMYSANDGYQDVKDVKLIIDGSVFHVGYLHLPFVWYKGSILFIAEAFSLGLLKKEEIKQLLYENLGDLNHAVSFDPFAYTLSIKDRFVINSDTSLYKIKNDYCQYLLDNGIPSINGEFFSLDDVHIIEYFGKIGNKELVSVQTDNVEIQNYWEKDLYINHMIFDKYQPMVHFNGQFYTIKEAYQSNVLSNDEIVEMSELLDDIKD